MTTSASGRASNERRKEWREKCQKRLAAYIASETGIDVQPQDVRLKPTSRDGYRWLSTKDKGYLFSKNLSKQSVSVYAELFHDVGVTFKVETAEVGDLHPARPELTLRKAGGSSSESFQSIIDRLESTNSKLKEQAEQERNEAELTKAAYEACLRQNEIMMNEIQGLQGKILELGREISDLLHRNNGTQKDISSAIAALHHAAGFLAQDRHTTLTETTGYQSSG